MVSRGVTPLLVALLLGAAIGVLHCPDGGESCMEKRSYPAPYEARFNYRPGDTIDSRYDPYRYYWQQGYNRYYPYSDDWRRGDQWYVTPYNPRVRLGAGRYRLVGRRDAEIICDFPYPQDVISNIVWVRADLPEYATRVLYRRHNGVTQRRGGSTLFLRDVTSSDQGLYRCLATARDPGTSALRTVYQDVYFYPNV